MEPIPPFKARAILQIYLDNCSEHKRVMAQRRAAEIMTSYSDLESEVESHFAKALTAARAHSSGESRQDSTRTGTDLSSQGG